MIDKRYIITPSDPPNEGIMFVEHEKTGRSGHLGHALVEYEPGKILAFYPNCSSEDQKWKGHSGFGWMEYKRSVDCGETWSDPIIEPNSKELFDRACGRSFMCEKAVCTDSGKIVLFYLQCDMVTNGHIWGPFFEPYFAISEDKGETFSDPQMLTGERGRIYDACYKDGVIYVLFLANEELPEIGYKTEHEMQLYVSEDDGKSFALRSVVPFQSTIDTFYGTMEFISDDSLIVYTYEELDEHNLKYIISRDRGFTWEKNRRAFFEHRMRNPQLVFFGGKYLMHGRSGHFGEGSGNFIIYSSDDAVHWDEGQFLRMRRPNCGCGAYSNNLIVHLPDGRQRLLIHTSDAYIDHQTNILMYWVDLDLE